MEDVKVTKYTGHITSNGNVIIVEPLGIALPLRLDLWNHSPDGFNWGYGGSGPAQTALAILAYHLKDRKHFDETRFAKKLADTETPDELAIKLHQMFKSDEIAKFPQELGFTWTTEQMRNWCLRAKKTLR